MLQLQRASAGSGKTYLLARKFIEFLISRRGEDGVRRLRQPRELRDSLKHILAITFTNKATSEMKLRIVDKLEALASWIPGDDMRHTDYLADFCQQFACGPEKIAELAAAALNVLLTDYGDFKLSTIDAFFQTVLRTFAYEADLDDTFGIEIDSDYVAQLGLDSTLDEFDSTPSASQGAKWVGQIMTDHFAGTSKGWNVFQKKYGNKTLYTQILEASKNLSNENFKKISNRLDDFFAETPDFFSYYRKLAAVYEADVRRAHARMRAAATTLLDDFKRIDLDIEVFGGFRLGGHASRMVNELPWNYNKADSLKITTPEFTRKTTSKRVFDPRKPNPYLDTPEEDIIEGDAIEMYKAYEKWLSLVKSERFARWLTYRKTLPYLGLLQSVRENSRLYLTDANTVELSDTNSILARIIGDDDAPFIYERMGARLEHFLIDEFQDTSTLQWQNLRPLLAESNAKGFDNLIIGDAKQSIYRFRNADPSLITSVVPSEFGASALICGNTPKENTNWRSSRRIVEFNNLFFRFFSSRISEEMESLYSNAVQPYSHKDDYGFVSLQLFESKEKEADSEIPMHFARVPELIADMLSRGYRMKDIAILVDRATHGHMIVDSILAYNRRPDAEYQIDFISADSLRIADAQSVQTVISVLESIQKGTRACLRSPEERRKKGVGDWSRLRADFSFFARQHPGLSLSEQLRLFLSGDYTPDAIRRMIAEMSTTVLPALVEKIILSFIPDALRQSEAPFLSAFLDSVLDYCDSRTADIASFLQWWARKGSDKSIASPENTDAVQVMTVHKSKGLEFRCVIVPYSTQTLTPKSSEKEWIWVEPDLHEATSLPKLPYLPVWNERSLLQTPHAGVYNDYLNKYKADKVNMAYVAYTRAVDELYIFAPVTLKNGAIPQPGSAIGEWLWQLGGDADAIIEEMGSRYPDSKPYLPEPSDFTASEQTLSWDMGRIPTRSEVLAASEARSGGKTAKESVVIAEYPVGTEIPALLYSDPTAPEGAPLPEDPAEEDSLPPETDESRRRGEMLHALMERVAVPADIPAAVRRLKTRGLIPRSMAPQLEALIADAVASVEEYAWFAPGASLLRERSIAVKGRMLRPDRVILRPDATAVIVDYKFGAHRADAAYRRQLARYSRALIAAGHAKKTEAYIWYVSLGEVVKM